MEKIKFISPFRPDQLLKEVVTRWPIIGSPLIKDGVIEKWKDKEFALNHNMLIQDEESYATHKIDEYRNRVLRRALRLQAENTRRSLRARREGAL